MTSRHVGVGTFSVTPEMRENVNKVLDSGRISYGPFSREFEKRFATLHDCRYGVLSNSGTSSLLVAIQALMYENKWRMGDEVIVPATTFVATPNVVIHSNLIPVFVDVDPDTYNIDMAQVERAITDDTVCVMPVHLFGQPCNMSRLIDIVAATRNRVKIVEDSCETMFARHVNHLVGSWGDIGCFSLYAAHLIVAGVGGIATTNNPDLAKTMRSLVNHGLSDSELRLDEWFSPQPAMGRSFRYDRYGHSFRVTELEAAIALAQLDDWEWQMARRTANAMELTKGLDYINERYGEVIHTPKLGAGNHRVWMMYPIVLNKDNNGEYVKKEKLTNYLNERGIETRDMLPILGQRVYTWLDPSDYPVSNWIRHSGFYVGCHQDLGREDMGYILSVMEDYYADESSRTA